MKTKAKCPSDGATGSEIRVHKFGHRKFGVVSASGKILRCHHEGISEGLQLIYTTSRKAEEVVQWIRKNPEAAYSPNH